VLLQSVAIAFAGLDCHMWLCIICQSLLWVSFHTCRSLLVVFFHTCWSLLRVLFVTCVVPQSDRAPLPVNFFVGLFCMSILWVSFHTCRSFLVIFFHTCRPLLWVSFVKCVVPQSDRALLLAEFCCGSLV